ncbi:MAG: hypothetical protein FWF92_11460 [Oscillospiraceae bacterium]|nr:hypothetical protein [Oscillospiraceae bacterium]
MKPNNHEQNKQYVFDSFCKTVLKNDSRNYYAEIKRQREKEISFSELSEQELAQLSIRAEPDGGCAMISTQGASDKHNAVMEIGNLWATMHESYNDTPLQS